MSLKRHCIFISNRNHQARQNKQLLYIVCYISLRDFRHAQEALLKQPPEVFYKKCSKNFTKFTGKQLRWSLLC